MDRSPAVARGDVLNVAILGTNGIDRSPCGTGTCARLAQRVTRGRLAVGETLVLESLPGGTFVGRAESEASVGDYKAIVPSIEGHAFMTGFNTLVVDERDPLALGVRLQ